MIIDILGFISSFLLNVFWLSFSIFAFFPFFFYHQISEVLGSTSLLYSSGLEGTNCSAVLSVAILKV